MNYRFQLAALQIDFICEMSNQSDVQWGLDELPNTLKDAYGEIYKRILAQNGSAPRLAMRAFQWIQCSYEPLCSETILDAIRVEIGEQGEFSCKETTAVNVSSLLKICQNLLIFDKHLNVFRFAHLSVDEYLETRLCKDDSHGEIAKVCLSLLCTPSYWGNYDQTLETKRGRHSDRHLLLYSAVFWPWHFSRCKENDMLTRLCTMLLSEVNHKKWLGYHRLRVKAYSYDEDPFWQRAAALREGRDDPLSAVGVFGLSRVFTTIFKTRPLEAGASADRLLLLASGFGDLEIARLLIFGGADVSAADKDGWTPLREAARHGHEAIARLLIDGGADVSTADKGGLTPLHHAAWNGYEAVVKLLMDWDADLSAVDQAESTPLHFAALNGHEAVARLLMDWGADARATDKTGGTPLHNAAWGGHEAAARLLMDRGADVSAADSSRSTPLHEAAFNGNEAVAKLLMHAGADVSAANKYGSTPLHEAASSGQEPVARLLIDGGADVSAGKNDGSTPLHLAARRGHEAVAKLLLGRGADVSAVDEAGSTPLHLATRDGHEEMAQLLTDWCADVAAFEGHGSKPLRAGTESA